MLCILMIFESLKFLSTNFQHIKDGISVIFWCYGVGEKKKPFLGNDGEKIISWMAKLRNENGSLHTSMIRLNM